jgi:hypothetical protein
LLKVINENQYHQEEKLLHHTHFVEDIHCVNCSEAKPNMTTMSTKTPLSHFVEGIHSVNCSKTKPNMTTSTKTPLSHFVEGIHSVNCSKTKPNMTRINEHDDLTLCSMSCTKCHQTITFRVQTIPFIMKSWHLLAAIITHHEPSSSAVHCGYIRSVYNDIFQIPGKQLYKNLHHEPEFLFRISDEQLSYTKICIQYIEFIFHFQKQQEDGGRLSSDVC